MLDICPMPMCWNCGFKFFTSFVDTSQMAFFFVKAFQILNWSNTQWSYWMKLMSVVWTRMCTWILSTWANLKLDSMCFDIHVYCIPIHLLDSCFNYYIMSSFLKITILWIHVLDVNVLHCHKHTIYSVFLCIIIVKNIGPSKIRYMAIVFSEANWLIQISVQMLVMTTYYLF